MGEVTEAKINRETGSNKSSASRELSLRTGNDVTLNLFSACDSWQRTALRMFTFDDINRGGSRGRVQGVCTP